MRGDGVSRQMQEARVIRRVLTIGLTLVVLIGLAFAGYVGFQYWRAAPGDRVVLTMPSSDLLSRAEPGSDPQSSNSDSAVPDAMAQSLALEIEQAFANSGLENAPDREALSHIVASLRAAGETQAIADLQSGNVDSALEALERAVQQSERDTAGHYRGMATLLATRNTSAAIETYRTAIARDPNNESAWRNLADLLYQSGDKEGAADAYRHVLSGSTLPTTEDPTSQPEPKAPSVPEPTEQTPTPVEEPATELVAQVLPKPNPWRTQEADTVGPTEPTIEEPEPELIPDPIETPIELEPEPDPLPATPEPISEPKPQAQPQSQPQTQTMSVAGAGLNARAKEAEDTGDWARAEMLYRQALDEETAVGNRQGMANQYGNLGNLAISMGRLSEAEDLIKQSLAIETEMNRSEGMAADYVSLGRLAMARNNHSKAERHFQAALEIEQNQSNQEGIASQYGNLGSVYATRGNFDKAETYYKSSLEIQEAIGNEDGAAWTLGNLGNLAYARSKFSTANGYYQRALTLEESLGSKAGMANQYANLGRLYHAMTDYGQAIAYWRQARDIFKELGRSDKVLEMEVNMGAARDAINKLR